ncbi:capsid assembly scaffolding protein Gp46 family protein [Alkalihalobacterium chitinilyticum]|uniref:DUF4355 domain-containing protein n=1 Tax=Alkalihalobacterium chitinilyticum TaxID=2980103 RepID=A0ABT5VJ59_9BACI|nr:DUF4355 domain-containing protein [Alkalihalobacterium chitinilyticum]MDE5415491.1 DUF4355 domain-containing protein [Alkalihalobacterium chitinilyticum]
MTDVNTNVNNPAVDDKQDPALDNQQNDTQDEKQFSQQDLDDIITKRLARERKQWEKALEEERKKANMDELERVRHEKEEAEKKATESSLKASEKLVLAEAKVQALALGIEAKKLNYVLKLADLEVPELVTEEGEVYEKGVKMAIKAIVTDFPELVSKPEVSKGGSDFSKGSNKGMTLEQFNALSYKEKVNLYNTNPELYRSFTTK